MALRSSRLSAVWWMSFKLRPPGEGGGLPLQQSHKWHIEYETNVMF
jgi:hypothetical protein